jgi:hypothetical protein
MKNAIRDAGGGGGHIKKVLTVKKRVTRAGKCNIIQI